MSETVKTIVTKANTSFEDWCKLVIAEVKRRDIDASRVTKLSAKHAWEYDETPASFVMQLQYMNDRRLRATETKPDPNKF